MKNIKLRDLIFVIASIACVNSMATAGTSSEGSTSPLIDMELEELMAIEVYSAGKKSQSLSEVSSAVYVITQEQIRRSGVTSIPEALRLAPGVEVARTGSYRWAITIRGFNNTFANKLLVLIDGRSIYSPLFAGVLWEEHDTLLEDIERIEVIRGPGATVWGANAVNGVINILTKHADETQGSLLVLGGGTEDKGTVKFRHGGKLESDTHYRFYIQGLNRDESADLNGNGSGDNWETIRSGFRIDIDKSDRDHFTLQGEISKGKLDVRRAEPSIVTPFSVLIENTADLSSGHGLFRWNHESENGAQSTLQIFYDRTNRDNDGLRKNTASTFDTEFQQRLELGNAQDLVWGLGYRHVNIETIPGRILSLNPDNRSDNLYSAFVQDEIELVPEKIRLTLGSKFEHNDYSGFEYQPSARVSWTPNTKWSAWSSISRAVRTPSRFEHDARINVVTFPPGELSPLPTMVAIIGADDVASEKLIAYEIGLRNQFSPGLSWDFATFYHRYDDITKASKFGTPFVENSTNVVQPVTLAKNLQAESWGAEFSMDWQPREHLRLQGIYSFLDLKVFDSPSLNAEANLIAGNSKSPRHRASILSSFRITPHFEWNTWLRYVNEQPDSNIGKYLEMDMQFTWEPRNDVSISLVGQNLLNKAHTQAKALDVGASIREIERGIYGKIEWRF